MATLVRLSATILYIAGMTLLTLSWTGWSSERELHSSFEAMCVSVFNFASGIALLFFGRALWSWVIRCEKEDNSLVKTSDIEIFTNEDRPYTSIIIIALVLGVCVQCVYFPTVFVYYHFGPELLVECPIYLPLYLLLASIPSTLVFLALQPMVFDAWSKRVCVIDMVSQWRHQYQPVPLEESMV